MAKPTQVMFSCTRVASSITLLIASLLLSGCAIFSSSYSSEVDADSLSNLDVKTSASTGWWVFEPSIPSQRGLIFYPGGKVEPLAYGALANTLSEQLQAAVIIVPMPLDLAVLGGKRAQDVIDAFPDISEWYIGGHSLGGTMAAVFAFDQPNDIAGLFLLASYPQEKHDFSDRPLPVLTVIGDRDGLISVQEWQATFERLPASASTVLIEGGNHAGFGHYGLQDGDSNATISAQAQQTQAVSAFLQWLDGEE